MSLLIKSLTLCLFTLIFIKPCVYGQVSTKQAHEIKETLSSTMVTLLFDTNSNSKSSKIFLIKLQIGEESVLENVEVSDNLDTLFKASYLSSINKELLGKQIKAMSIKPQQLIIPVHYVYGNVVEQRINTAKTLSFISFNNIPIKGYSYWLPPIVTNRN